MGTILENNVNNLKGLTADDEYNKELLKLKIEGLEWEEAKIIHKLYESHFRPSGTANNPGHCPSKSLQIPSKENIL